MTLLEKINADAKEALKARLEVKVQALRFLLSQVHNREIEKKGSQKGELTDEDVLDVLRKEVKKRKEALELFKKSGRDDLVRKEEGELVYFEPYLPKMPEMNEIESAVTEVVSGGKNDFGSVMKEVMARFKGQADGRIVGEVVKKKLGGINGDDRE